MVSPTTKMKVKLLSGDEFSIDLTRFSRYNAPIGGNTILLNYREGAVTIPMSAVAFIQTTPPEETPR